MTIDSFLRPWINILFQELKFSYQIFPFLNPSIYLIDEKKQLISFWNSFFVCVRFMRGHSKSIFVVQGGSLKVDSWVRWPNSF